MLYKTTHGLIICYLLCLHHQYCRRYVRPPNHKNKNSAVSWWQRKELWIHSAFSFCRCSHLGILKRHVQFGALEIRFRFMTCSEGDVSTHMSTCTHQKPSETWPYLFVTPCHCDLYVPSENLPWVPKGTLHPSAHHMSLRKSHKTIQMKMTRIFVHKAFAKILPSPLPPSLTTGCFLVPHATVFPSDDSSDYLPQDFTVPGHIPCNCRWLNVVYEDLQCSTSHSNTPST